MYAAFLDSCVLVPNVLTDTLLRLAEYGFFRPLWSQRILDEMEYAIHKVHPDFDEAKISGRSVAMNATFEDALVSGWDELIAGLDLPDDNDRHVLAAAIAGGAQSLVTFNLKHFPITRLENYGIEARHPDDFLLDQLDLFPALALQSLRQQADELSNPASDLPSLLNRLERCGVPRFVDQARLLL